MRFPTFMFSVSTGLTGILLAADGPRWLIAILAFSAGVWALHCSMDRHLGDPGLTP